MEYRRDTPGARITYLDYRHKMEFTYESTAPSTAIAARATGPVRLVLGWRAVDFMEQFDTALQSRLGHLTDLPLQKIKRATGRPMMSFHGHVGSWQIDSPPWTCSATMS